MADKSLQVNIGADTSSLASASAIAKAELRAVSTEFSALAKAATESGEAGEAAAAKLAEMAPKYVAVTQAAHAAAAAFKEATAASQETGLASAMEEIAGKAEALTSKLSVVQRTLSALSEVALAGLGLEQIAEGINHVAETGEQLEKLSQETGLTTEQLSGLRVMAVETGTDFDQFTTLLQRLPNTLQNAAINPSSKAGEAFRAMGIQVTDATGQIRPMGDILDDVSAKLASYADGANKTGLETDIFGSKIGANLLPMLNQLGTVGLQGAIEKSNELGQTWSQQDADAASHFEEDLHRVELGLEGMAAGIIKFAIPALDQLAHAFSEMTGTASVADQIATVQAQLDIAQNNHGRFSTAAEIPHFEAELASLKAQQAQLTSSMAGQSATAGGAAPGTVQAPDLKGGGHGLGAHQGAGGADVADDGDNSDSSGVMSGSGGGSSGVSAAKQAQAQITQIAADGASARKEIVAAEYEGQVSSWDAEVAQGKMSKAQEIQAEEAAQQKIYESALTELEREAELDKAGTAARAKALDDVAVLTALHNAEMAKMESDLVTQQVEDAQKVKDAQLAAAAETSAAWQRAFQPISQAFDTSIRGIIQGTETMRQAEVKAAQSITLSFVDAASKKLVSFVASEAEILARGVLTETGLTSATIAGNAARLTAKTAADATGKAADVALGTAQINSSALKAAAGAYSAVAGIPLVGPALAPVAAATAYAGVMAFDVLSAEGGMAIPAGLNPLVQLHEKEMVLPAYIAQPLQSMVSGGGGGDDGAYSNVNNIHMSMTGGGDAGDFEHRVMSALNNRMRSGNFQRYPAVARAMRR